MALKGPAGALTQFNFALGVLVAQTVGYDLLVEGAVKPEQFSGFFALS